MSFSSEFRNVVTPNSPMATSIPITAPAGVRADRFGCRSAGSGGALTLWNGGNPSVEFLDEARFNTLSLQAIVDWMASRMPPIPQAGIVYFPPGRYYFGRRYSTRAEAPRPSEAAADIVIPPNIELRFALGATAVLFDYSILDSAARVRFERLIEGRQADRFKVSMELQGASISAGPWTIFDSVMEDLSTPEGRALAPTALHESGPVFITRNSVPELYPEWFGAALPGEYSGEPTPAIVRRTTLGLQRAIDVGHTWRHLPTYVDVPGAVPGTAAIAGSLIRPGAPAEPGWVLLEGGMYRILDGSVREAAVPSLGLVGFAADYRNFPTIPVALSGEYVIDRELRVGFSLDDAERYSETLGAERPGPTQRPNIGPFVLRGRAGLAPSGAPLAVIRAHSSFRPHATTVPLSTSTVTSLLGVRGPTGSLIESVTFDAALTAARCLTFDTVSRAQMHGTGVVGCAFHRATVELLHIGGEFSPVATTAKQPRMSNTFDNIHFSHGQDHVGFRAVRCIFDTGSVDALQARGWAAPTGVLYRAGQAMAAVFESCSFTGPAAPMFHAVTLRMAIVGCAFDTRAIGSRHFDGADLWIDASVPEVSSAGSIPSDPATLTIKDVVSRSPRFITSFLTPEANGANHTAITLIGVDHRPTLRATEPLPPAILWAGPARNRARLVLMGCRFDRLDRPLVLGDVLEPIAVDLASGTRDTSALVTFVEGINDRSRGDGHIIDLGTAIVRPGRTVRIASLEPTLGAIRDPGGRFSPDLERRVDSARVLERYGVR